MNDFGDIERELKKLRPAQPSANFLERVDVDLARDEKIVRPHQFRIHWWSLGASLAAAAVILIFLRFDFRKQAQTQSAVATAKPVPSTFLPAGATHVVYHSRDEGLYFPQNSEQPMRRRRSVTQETWQWRNPATGASLQVSYPAEHVDFVPVYGQ